MRRYTRQHAGERLAVLKADQRVAKALGLTVHQLRILAVAVARPDGRVMSGGTARGKLVDKGLATDRDERYQHHVTDAGRALVAQARGMGF